MSSDLLYSDFPTFPYALDLWVVDVRRRFVRMKRRQRLIYRRFVRLSRPSMKRRQRPIYRRSIPNTYTAESTKLAASADVRKNSDTARVVNGERAIVTDDTTVVLPI